MRNSTNKRLASHSPATTNCVHLLNYQSSTRTTTLFKGKSLLLTTKLVMALETARDCLVICCWCLPCPNLFILRWEAPLSGYVDAADYVVVCAVVMPVSFGLRTPGALSSGKTNCGRQVYVRTYLQMKRVSDNNRSSTSVYYHLVL